jgi:transposase-like protein
MDCLYVNVKEKMTSVKKAVYVALGIDIEGNKEILDFWIGDSESSSFWYGVLEELKLRGVKDIIYLCSDGVAGFKDILEQSFPKTIHQRCIVHIIRNLTKCLPRKKWQEFCKDLKTIYKTTDIETAKEASKIVLEKWKDNIILCKKLNQDIPHMLQLYDYTACIRKLVYTTNPIESMNSALRKVTNGKGSFVNEQALEKVLYLRIKELQEKWIQKKTSNWPEILNELLIMHGERVEKHIKI